MMVTPFDQTLCLKPLIEHYSGSPTFQPDAPGTASQEMAEVTYELVTFGFGWQVDGGWRRDR
jgi:hypothetical protein